jgi:hypothetical protein
VLLLQLDILIMKNIYLPLLAHVFANSYAFAQDSKTSLPESREVSFNEQHLHRGFVGCFLME